MDSCTPVVIDICRLSLDIEEVDLGSKRLLQLAASLYCVFIFESVKSAETVKRGLIDLKRSMYRQRRQYRKLEILNLSFLEVI